MLEIKLIVSTVTVRDTGEKKSHAELLIKHKSQKPITRNRSRFTHLIGWIQIFLWMRKISMIRLRAYTKGNIDS